jgi:integrase/recombinase XerD
MKWADYIKDFQYFLKLEKSLSGNSIDAYTADLKKLLQYLDFKNCKIEPESLTIEMLRDFIVWINDLGMSSTTQARVISGIKAFYRFLLLDERIHDDPTLLLEAPKTGRKLPDLLSLEEINLLVSMIDLSSQKDTATKP